MLDWLHLDFFIRDDRHPHRITGTLNKIRLAIGGMMRDLRVETLTAAFHDDPMTEFLFPEQESRTIVLSTAMEFLWGLSFEKSQISTDEDECAGAIGTLPPGQYPVPFLKLLSLISKFVSKSVLSGLPIRVIYECLRIFSQLDKAHLLEPHWYVQVLGVRPNHQGKGLGGKLLRPVLEKADQAGVVVYLETSNPKNLDFYRKHGFEVMEEITPVDGCPAVRRMLRKPIPDSRTGC
jgi:ribosomal protein S18 acetylase RimI-like enzyme